MMVTSERVVIRFLNLSAKKSLDNVFMFHKMFLKIFLDSICFIYFIAFSLVKRHDFKIELSLVFNSCDVIAQRGLNKEEIQLNICKVFFHLDV